MSGLAGLCSVWGQVSVVYNLPQDGDDFTIVKNRICST